MQVMPWLASAPDNRESPIEPGMLAQGDLHVGAVGIMA